MDNNYTEALIERIIIFLKKNSFQHRFFNFLEDDANDDSRVIFLWGERGCGKSFGVMMYLLLLAVKHGSNFNGLYVRKKAKALNNAGVVNEALDFIQGFEESVNFYNDSRDSEITLRTGGKITFAAAYNRERVRGRFKGIHFNYIVLDEAAENTECVMKELFACMRSSTQISNDITTHKVKSRILILANPRYNCWIRKYLDPYLTPKGFALNDMDGKKLFFYDRRDDNDRKYKFFAKSRESIPKFYRDSAIGVTSFYGRVEDNGFWLKQNPEYKASVKFTINDEEISWGEKSCNDDGELIFSREDFILLSPTLIAKRLSDPDALVLVSCDFASGSKRVSSGLSAIGVYGLSAREDFYVLDCITGRYNMREAVDKIIALASKWKTRCIVIEQIQMGTPILDELKALNRYEVIAATHSFSRTKRFSLFRKYVNSRRVFLREDDPSSSLFINQAINYDELPTLERKAKKIYDDLLITACHAINTLIVDKKYLLSKGVVIAPPSEVGSLALQPKISSSLKEMVRPACSRSYGLQFTGIA